MKYSFLSNQFELYKDDIFGVLKTGLLLLVFLGGFRIFPLLVDKWINRNLAQKTFGIVTKIEADK